MLLSNTKKNDSNKDIIFNQQSVVRSAPAYDIDFDYSPKPIEVKSTQKMTLVKEDRVLEDETGTAEIHIWDELINKVKNGTT